MKFKFTIDWCHWMLGFSTDRANYTTLFSLGPINLWTYNERRAQIDEEIAQLERALMEMKERNTDGI